MPTAGTGRSCLSGRLPPHLRRPVEGGQQGRRRCPGIAGPAVGGVPTPVRSLPSCRSSMGTGPSSETSTKGLRIRRLAGDRRPSSINWGVFRNLPYPGHPLKSRVDTAAPGARLKERYGRMDAQPREASAICASHTRAAGRHCEEHIAPQTCRFTAGEGLKTRTQ